MAKKYQTGSTITDFSFMTPWDGEKTFYSAGSGRKKVLFFLRYYGCTVTQLKLHELNAYRGKFYDAGAQLYVAMQSSVETVRSKIKKEDVDYEILCDPDGTLYRLFDIGYSHLGYFTKGMTTFPPGVTPPTQKYWDKLQGMIDEASAIGITHDLYEGDEQQLHAIFVLDENNRALFAYYAEDVADFPSFDELLGYL